MEMLRIKLTPTSVPEWNAEDEVFDVLSSEAADTLDDTAVRTLLDETNIELPKALDWNELVSYAARRKTALEGVKLAPDGKRYDYYLIEVPLTLMVPAHLKLVRLRLELQLTGSDGTANDILAYDLFPNTQVDVKTLMSGNASIDVSKALQFVLLASGPTAALAPAAKCLGLTLNVPFQWTSTVATITSSARMSNPVRWSLTDEAIRNGFSASVIARVPKDEKLSVKALLLGELRQTNPLGFSKTQFTSPQHTYTVG
jgi:hypothetical protein